MTKLLVLYVFHIYNDRVKHFINNCIFYDKDIDFIIISNENDNQDNIEKNYHITGFQDSVKMLFKDDIMNNNLQFKDNVRLLFRDNIGYDFGGWSDALLSNNLYENYDNFIFVNSSVIGPFIPSYYNGKWTDIYINGLQNNVKLFGSTINTIEKPLESAHVQSYIFSTDKPTLYYLIQCEIFSITNYAKTFFEAIYNKEVLMSRKIIDNGWNIGSLFQLYNNVDFTFKNKTPEEYNIPFLNDIMYLECRNILWNEYQLVFIKGNRVNISLQHITKTLSSK